MQQDIYQKNQATAQLYRVIADNRFPYYLYAGQQDNTTFAIPSRTASAGIGEKDWYPVAGGESAFIALDPNNPEKVYGTNYLGNISVYDLIISNSQLLNIIFNEL